MSGGILPGSLIATGEGPSLEAVDNRLGRRVAVKVLKSEFSPIRSSPNGSGPARTTAMLNHPYASVHDYGESQMNGRVARPTW